MPIKLVLSELISALVGLHHFFQPFLPDPDDIGYHHFFDPAMVFPDKFLQQRGLNVLVVAAQSYAQALVPLEIKIEFGVDLSPLMVQINIGTSFVPVDKTKILHC